MPSSSSPAELLVGEPLPNFSPPPRPDSSMLAGNFCRLEALDAGRHATELYVANVTDAEQLIWTYLPYGPFDDVAGYSAWVAEQAALDDPWFYAIIDQQTGLATGVASYLRIMPASASIEVGHINFSPLLQNTPAASEAMYLMMRNAFELGYRRYEWKCDSLNQRSCNAATRLGFQFEGIFRQATVYKNRNRDTAWYSIIDKEWPELKAAFETWLHADNFDADSSQRTRLSTLTAAINTQHRDKK